MSSVLAVIDRPAKPTQQFTRGWMLTEATVAHGKSLGFASGTDF